MSNDHDPLASAPLLSLAGIRTLGNGLVVPALGLGCMSMTSAYGPTADKTSMLELIR